VPLDSLCPDAAFAEHNTTTSSGKPARDAIEQTELCRTMRSRAKRAPLMMAGATTPASNEEADRLIFKRVEDIFAKYPIATSLSRGKTADRNAPLTISRRQQKEPQIWRI
jgi:hypothetical protein